MQKYLSETVLLNFRAPQIAALVKERGWNHRDPYEQIEQIYHYVKDEIPFGYNADDATAADRVLRDGYGQCNTKAILVMALLRAVGIPCRLHGFTLDKQVQSGVMGILYRLSPQTVVHTWAEVSFDGKWLPLEGLILDRRYLKKIQQKYSRCSGTFCGWGVSTQNLQDPEVDWRGTATFIQKEGIVDDLGVYDSPDDFYRLYQQKLSRFKRVMFRVWGRHYMNRKVRLIRGL